MAILRQFDKTYSLLSAIGDGNYWLSKDGKSPIMNKVGRANCLFFDKNYGSSLHIAVESSGEYYSKPLPDDLSLEQAQIALYEEYKVATGEHPNIFTKDWE